MTEKTNTVLALIDGIGKAWPVALGLIFLVGWCYTLQDQVTSDHSTILVMQSHDVMGRLQGIDLKQANDEASTSGYYSDIKAQLSSIQSRLDQTNNSINAMGQDVAVLKSKAGFFQNPASYPSVDNK